MSTISTHVLDVSRGRPAEGVPVALEKQDGKEWRPLSIGKTNADGRLKDLVPGGHALQAGVYRLSFDTAVYFEAHSQNAFYPVVQVIFEVAASQHYHVPLLLSPFGYSTYRGS